MAKRKTKKPAKSTKSKVSRATRTTKRKSTTRRRKSGNPFGIGEVKTLI